jgi:hypothetical protein
MSDTPTIKDCQIELATLLKDKPVALNFIDLYVTYANLVDDIVDEKDYQNSAKFLKHSELAETVHTHPYWLQNAGWLKVATLVVHNDYADSVIFEHSDDAGKKQLADSLRIAAIHLVLLVVYNELGYDAMRAISPKFRHALWKRHKNEGH